jgi:hypothetical protein
MSPKEVAMKINAILLISLAIVVSSSSILANSRYLSGSADVQQEEFVNNSNTQQIQTNEQQASGQMSSAQANTITNQQENMLSQQRVIEGQIAGEGEIVVNPPSNYNQAQQEQVNLQENSIDMQLNPNGASMPPAAPGQMQQNNQPSSSGGSNMTSSSASGGSSTYGP